MRAILWQVLKFLLFGGITIVIYYSILVGLTEAGVWYLVSATSAFVPAHIVNFLLQKYLTFQNKTRHNVRWQAMAYALVMLLVFLPMNNGILYVLVEYCSTWYVAANLVSSLIVSAISFPVQRKWIFALEPPAA